MEKSLHEGREQEKKINWNYDGGKKSKSRDRIESKKMRQNKFYQCGVHVRVEWILFAVFVAPKTYIEHQPAHAPKTVKRKGAREKKYWTWQSKSVSGNLNRGQYGMWYQSNIYAMPGIGISDHPREVQSFALTFRLDYIKIQLNWEKSISYKFPENFRKTGWISPLIAIKLAMISPSAPTRERVWWKYCLNLPTAKF